MSGSPEEVLTLVEAHLLTAFGPDPVRGSVTFLGTQRYDVLRFGPDSEARYRYVTVGLSREPCGPAGERAELLWTVSEPRDSVLRPLATLAAAPAVEGLQLGPGAVLDLGAPLWEGARFSAMLVGEAGGQLADLDLSLATGESREAAPGAVVGFLPVFPMTPDELAFARAAGAAALRQRWLARGVDLRDPGRPGLTLR